MGGVGDVHGDLKKTVTSLELAGVLEMQGGDRPVWTGGDATVVQMGDVLDRGDCELRVLLLLRRLDEQARRVGGAVWMLNGNHESLNVMGDFRYVTPGAFWESATLAGVTEEEAAADPRSVLRARWELFRPGGRVALELAANPTVLVVNDIVFAHGGLLPHHLGYGLERINAEVAHWMAGVPYEQGASGPPPRPPAASAGTRRPRPPFEAFGDATSIMWNRTYGREREAPHERRVVRDQLMATLRALRARALVVGHTPQARGLNADCEGRVWRVDVGMSAGVMDADPAVLEFSVADADGVVTATARRAPPRWHSMREPGDPYHAAERAWKLTPLDQGKAEPRRAAEAAVGAAGAP
ncbi:hypothetical protein QBZ16_001424 [Prototheca wickerhamii]|uniref:Calcineurin-like phosphoesterase domain-containing protein n=1 Tax=Prototheca wickerhamii TaxID=3111 RepID=A0AAD9IDR4_PROWI|nr:hypothetical protein QBZ16_001424 [Prototheca wickerhamii]